MALLLFCSNAAADPLLIVNTSVEDTVLGQDDIKLIFLGKKKKWGNYYLH